MRSPADSSRHPALGIEFSLLYPPLNKLQRKGWVNVEWGLSEHNRKAHFYPITPEGRQQLEREAKGFDSW